MSSQREYNDPNVLLSVQHKTKWIELKGLSINKVCLIHCIGSPAPSAGLEQAPQDSFGLVERTAIKVTIIATPALM